MDELMFWLFILGAFIAVIVSVVKWFGKIIKEDEEKKLAFVNKINNDPAYIVEARLHKKLNGLDLNVFASSSLDYDLSFEEKRNKKIKRCVDYLEDGALMVCTNNLLDSWSNPSLGSALYTYTPHCTFCNEIKSSEEGGHKFFSILTTGCGFGVKKYFSVSDMTVTNKKSSVAGSAIAGGILAGGVGAVVGAVHAMDKNASGGTNKVTFSGNNFYGVTLFTNRIDHIVISKKLIDRVKKPDEKYILIMNDQYCVIDKGLANINKDELKEITEYLNSLVLAIATWDSAGKDKKK